MKPEILLDVWTLVGREYFPPAEMVVWTSDGTSVRKGTWHFEPGMTLEESNWTDEDGKIITVTHWCGLDESPEGEPSLPPPLKSIAELMAEQKPGPVVEP